MTLSRRSTIKAIGIVGAGSALTGTALAVSEHEDDERDPEDAPADDEAVGALRVGHFSPDAPNVDVYVDDEQILSDVGYDELSPYLEVAPGTYTVTITAAGEDQPVYEETVSLDAEYYTAAAIGELEGEADLEEEIEEDEPGVGEDVDEPELEDDEHGEDDYENDVTAEDDPAEPDTGTFELLLLVDAEPENVEEGTSQVRLVHASPDAPAVDVTDADTGEPVFQDVDFSEPSGYTPVEPGAYTLDVFPAGEADPEDPADEEPADEMQTDEEPTNGEYEDDPTEDVEDEPEDGVEAEPVASVDVDLEENTAYTAFAIGYLEELAEEEMTIEEDDHANDTAEADEIDGEEVVEPGDDEVEEDGEVEEDAYDDNDVDEGEEHEDEYEDEDDEDELDDEFADDVAENDVDERPFTIRLAVDGMTDEAPEADEPTTDEDDVDEPADDAVDAGDDAVTADD